MFEAVGMPVQSMNALGGVLLVVYEGVFKRNRCRWISAVFSDQKILKLFGCFEQIY